MTTLTYAELFAGAGGLSMGLELAGWEPVAHAEIEPHARAVLREHWPTCRLDGDVSQVNGADYAGVTLLSGGSPCQDLSVAGKRAGMTEGSGTRSSLYYQQVRIWIESGAPYFLWENVLGAFSSNTGRDFAAVLSALVGAAIAVPADGWESAGVAAGPTGVAAWRVLDCQFFGPPQRRRRVFVLGARAGGVDTAEVLALSEGVRGDPPARREAGEGLAADAVGGTDGEEYISLVLGSDPISRVGGPSQPVTGRNGDPGVVLAVNISDGAGQLDGVMGTLGARSGGQEVGAQTRGVGLRPASAVAFDTTQVTHPENRSNPQPGDPCHPLAAGAHVPLAVTYDARGNGEGAGDCTISGDHQNRVTDYTAIVLRNREGKPGGGKGPLLSEERLLTRASANDQVLFTMASGQANAEITRDKAPTLNNNHDGAPIAFQGVGIPRRLMPIETERLMGWPDGHTEYGVITVEEIDWLLEREAPDLDPTPRGEETPKEVAARLKATTREIRKLTRDRARAEKEGGRTRYALSDTARYRLCGNGVASPVAAWIGWRLRWALEAATPTTLTPESPSCPV